MPEQYRRPHHHERVQTTERMKRAWADESDAREAVQAFNARLDQGRVIWAWPTIAAAITGTSPLGDDRVRELRRRDRSGSEDETAGARGLDPSRASRGQMSALQRPRSAADRAAGTGDEVTRPMRGPGASA